MGVLYSFVKKIVKLLFYLTVFIAAVLLIPNLPPYTQFSSIQLDPTQPRTGALTPNDILNNPDKIHEGKLIGPEAFDLHNGEVYTGLATGEVVKVSPGGHVTFVTKVGTPCAGSFREDICGRILGLQIDKKNNQLYLVDTYYGIWKVDLKTNKKHLLVSPNVEIEGATPKLFNDLTIHSNGDLFWTHSSIDYHLKDGAYVALSDPSGRLLHYNAAKNTSTVLLDHLSFANGVVLSPDEQFLLVVETGGYKVIKYYIAGPKKGKSEVFVAGLPGAPDNIRVLPDGSGVLVSLFTAFDEEHPLLMRSLAPLPLVRKFIMRVATMIENTFEFLNTQFPHPILDNAVYKLGNIHSVASLYSGHSGLIQIDWNGKIIASYFSTDGKVPHISDAIVVNDKLWTGTPDSQNTVSTFPAPELLKKAFANNKPLTADKIKEKEIPIKENMVEKKEVPKVVKPSVPAPEAKKVDEAKQKPSQPPIKSKPNVEEKPRKAEQPEKKPVVNTKEAKIEPKEAPKQNVNTKPATNEAKLKSNNDNVKPKETPKESETKKTVASDTKQKVTEGVVDKSKVKQPEKPKNNDKAPEKKPITPPTNQQKTASSGTETKKAPQAKPIEKPVVEEIPLDTTKPSKEKLKVIKKSGPDVIPNPNM